MAATGATRRIDVLANPKPLPGGFLEDRRSVYWIDKKPPKHGPDGTTILVVTPRLEELARHKTAKQYQGDRPTPEWTVSDGAKGAEASARLSDLAAARPVHNNYKYERSVYTTVPDSARKAEATPRLGDLSEPKPHKLASNPDKDSLDMGEFSEPITPVTPGAKSARCPPRVEQLAEARPPHQQFKGERPVQWPIPENVKNASAGIRLQLLARPKSGRLKSDDYDPYTVSTAARQSKPTPRVEELAAPIPRKVKTKKVV